MFQKMFENVRSKNPLIHNITNYVTVNDCANIVIACGASPIMADDKDEVEDITNICDGLNINIGTLNSRTIESNSRYKYLHLQNLHEHMQGGNNR